MEIALRTKSVNDIAADDEVVGSLQIAADDLSGARQTFQDGLKIRQQQDDKGEVAQFEAALATVSIEQGGFPEAEQKLRKSLAEFHAENAVLQEIPAETELSRALLAEGKLGDARQTISNAAALSASSSDPALKLPIAMLDARIEAAELSARPSGKSKVDFSAPLRKLTSVVSAAHRLGYLLIECDARLALGEIELRENPSAARLHLARLAMDAHQHGLELVARKAAALQKSGAPRS
jgi:hypothetical protein